MPPADRLTVLEEFSFRRIANAGVKASLLRPHDLQRLLDLGLAMISEDRVVLTEFGRARFADLQGNGKPDVEDR